MKGKRSNLDSRRFEELWADFAAALGAPVSDFVEERDYEQDYSWRKDYRYTENQTLPFLLIDLYERCTKVVIDTMDGPRVYEWYDSETLETLRPLIHRTLKKSFEELRSQIVYKDGDTKVIVRPGTISKEATLLYLWYKGEQYSAEVKDGRVRLNVYDMPPDILTVYMRTVEKYLVPCVREAKKDA